MAKRANESEYRYERKFVVAGRSAADLEDLVRLAPGCFREIYTPRHVNNIYFDTRAMDCFSANVMGLSDRLKTRIRWYGTLLGEIAEPTLEIKVRSSSVGTKHSYRLAPFSLETGTLTRDIQTALQPLPPHAELMVSTLRPVLLNRYKRRYYLSADRLFRITIDRDLSYRGIDVLRNRFMRREVQAGETVLELKYDKAHADAADSITQFFSFRMTKSSKYINGIKRVDIRYAGVRV